jgi:hypothetical protein
VCERDRNILKINTHKPFDKQRAHDLMQAIFSGELLLSAEAENKILSV